MKIWSNIFLKVNERGKIYVRNLHLNPNQSEEANQQIRTKMQGNGATYLQMHIRSSHSKVTSVTWKVRNFRRFFAFIETQYQLKSAHLAITLSHLVTVSQLGTATIF